MIDDLKVVDIENATYVTDKFKIIEIEDLHYNKFDNIDKLSPSKINIFDKTGSYSINNVYTEKINFWLNKEIARDKKIRDSRDYKKMATYEDPSNGAYTLHNICVPEYKGYLTKYFYDIDGTSGIYKQYYPDGVLEKECYHNGDKYEGPWVNYIPNGQGTRIFKNGDRCFGKWENGILRSGNKSYAKIRDFRRNNC